MKSPLTRDIKKTIHILHLLCDFGHVEEKIQYQNKNRMGILAAHEIRERLRFHSFLTEHITIMTFQR